MAEEHKMIHGVSKSSFKEVLGAAMPIMLGYVAIGIPCGILCASIGLNVLQVFLMSALFYSGAGQFMIPNMYLAASSVPSIVASVSLVNTRQMLYSASFSQECGKASKLVSFLFAATVTDESYGVSIARFKAGGWSVKKALGVNLLSQSSWTISNMIGVIVGSLIDIPLVIASFAMTSIFICLLFSQKPTAPNIVAALFAAFGVYVCKAIGLSGAAILIGAVLGVVVALIFYKATGSKQDPLDCDDVCASEVSDTGEGVECASEQGVSSAGEGDRS